MECSLFFSGSGQYYSFLQAQYTFLHEALVEALLCPSSAVPCERFPHMCKKLLEMDPKTRMTRLQGDFEVTLIAEYNPLP